MKPKDAVFYDVDRRPWNESKELLSQRVLTKIQDRLNPAIHTHLAANKLDYHVACVTRGVVAPPVLAVIDFTEDTGRAKTLGARRVTDASELSSFLSALQPNTCLAFKPIGGTLGRGVICLTASETGVADQTGRSWQVSEILAHCRQDKEGFLVQPWLEPDPALRALMPSLGFGMVRIVSLLHDGEAFLPFGWIKIPTGDNVLDIFSGGQTGNLIAAIDVETGVIGEALGPPLPGRQHPEIVEHHPTTGAQIAGFQIPRWHEVLEAVRTGATSFSEFRTLGWDIAIAKQGTYLLEANSRWSAVIQMPLRRGIRSDMNDFLSLVNAAWSRTGQ